MASMRRVTKKPPKILIPAKNTETPAKIITRLVDPICSAAPRIMIEEIAFVTAINGVCNEWLGIPNYLKTDKYRQDKQRNAA